MKLLYKYTVLTWVIMKVLSSIFISCMFTHTWVTFDKINPERMTGIIIVPKVSSVVITSGRSARPCFEVDQTSSRQIRDIFKEFWPTLCRRIRDNREIWHGQTCRRNIPKCWEALITLLNILHHIWRSKWRQTIDLFLVLTQDINKNFNKSN